MNFDFLKNKFFIILGPNVIESEEHTIKMAKKIKEIMTNYDVTFFFYFRKIFHLYENRSRGKQRSFKLW